MRIPRSPHAWSVTPKRAVAIQRELAPRVRIEAPRRPLVRVAGIDAAFTTDGSGCIAGVVLWDSATGSVLEQHVRTSPVRFPYIPGLLSFREVPAILAVLRDLERIPDGLMCDGQGLAHPRRLGLACHLGLIVGLPSIGCAKSRLIGSHREPGLRRGAKTALRDGPERIGTVLRTRDGVRPVYVSAGHLVDLKAAESVVLTCGRGRRLPEPTRLADRMVARFKREYGGEPGIRTRGGRKPGRSS